MISLVSEASEVARKAGIKLEPLDPKCFCDPQKYPPKSTTETKALMNELDKMGVEWSKSAKTHTGIWHDLVYRRRKTEIDYLIKPIVDKGKELGVPTPLNAAVLQMIHEIEDNNRPMSPINFQELACLAAKLDIELP